MENNFLINYLFIFCRQFCTGEYKKDGVPIGYKGSHFHRVIKVGKVKLSPVNLLLPLFKFQDFMIQGGDFVNVSAIQVLLLFFRTYHFLIH